LKGALTHPFKNDQHHPEFFENGVDDMTLIDLIEMLCDWKTSTLRHSDGNIWSNIEHNAKRFNLTPQFFKVLQNTVPPLVSLYGSSTQKHLSTH
jgi:hypothetical protein